MESKPFNLTCAYLDDLYYLHFLFETRRGPKANKDCIRYFTAV